MKAKWWERKDFMSPQECRDAIIMAEDKGFEKATLNVPGGETFRLEYRNNDRFIFDSTKLAEELWERIKGDENLNVDDKWKAYGLNHRFRIYKYTGDQYFALHYDGQFLKVPEQDMSWVTLLVYLNDGFEGGETSFQDGECKPEEGKASLMTQTNVLHEALPVKNGKTKYVLRTDVMYKKIGE